MQERYSRLFTLPNNMYCVNSPVIVLAGALLKDNTTGQVLVQLKIQNVSVEEIKATKVEIQCFDIAGRGLPERATYQYLDLNVRKYEEFAQETPIILNNIEVRSFKVTITEVVFRSGQIWSSTEICHQIPHQIELVVKFDEVDLVKLYQNTYGQQCIYVPKRYENLWFCTCGAINNICHDNCHLCNVHFSKLETITKDSLREIQQANLQEAERIHQAQIESEEQRIITIKSDSKKLFEKELKKICSNYLKLTLGFLVFTVFCVIATEGPESLFQGDYGFLKGSCGFLSLFHCLL